MKITGVKPWLIKSNASYWGEFLFVEVTTDAGVSGWGEITTTTKLANRALCTILRHIGEAIRGVRAVAGPEGAKVGSAVVSSVLGAVMTLYFVAVMAAVHRQLAGRSPDVDSATFD